MTDIGRAFLTKAWIFQAIIASPTFIFLGAEAMFAVWEPTYWTVYDFITFSFTATMAGGIIFLVLVQRQLPNAGKLWTFRFELAKAVIATGLWIWLLYVCIRGTSSLIMIFADHADTGRTLFSGRGGGVAGMTTSGHDGSS
jgi:hypothetical protein